jgi:urease accessory protein UreE
MLVESAIRNLQDPRDFPSPVTIDWLDLTWLECRTRFARKCTRSGRELRLLLRIRETLKNNDLLGFWPDGQAVVVNLLCADVLKIPLQSFSNAVAAAFQIGNLHVPMELAADSLLVPFSSQTEAALAESNICFEAKHMIFQPTHWPPSVQLSPKFQVTRRPSEAIAQGGGGDVESPSHKASNRY